LLPKKQLPDLCLMDTGGLDAQHCSLNISNAK
jgi:hypothetical protein